MGDRPTWDSARWATSCSLTDEDVGPWVRGRQQQDELEGLLHTAPGMSRNQRWVAPPWSHLAMVVSPTCLGAMSLHETRASPGLGLPLPTGRVGTCSLWQPRAELASCHHWALRAEQDPGLLGLLSCGKALEAQHPRLEHVHSPWGPHQLRVTPSTLSSPLLDAPSHPHSALTNPSLTLGFLGAMHRPQGEM